MSLDPRTEFREERIPGRSVFWIQSGKIDYSPETDRRNTDSDATIRLTCDRLLPLTPHYALLPISDTPGIQTRRRIAHIDSELIFPRAVDDIFFVCRRAGERARRPVPSTS